MPMGSTPTPFISTEKANRPGRAMGARGSADVSFSKISMGCTRADRPTSRDFIQLEIAVPALLRAQMRRGFSERESLKAKLRARDGTATTERPVPERERPTFPHWWLHAGSYLGLPGSNPCSPTDSASGSPVARWNARAVAVTGRGVNSALLALHS